MFPEAVQPPDSRPAISVQQPYAEQILLGVKVYEYRGMKTHKRGRVYIYASRTIRVDQEEWERIRMTPLRVVRGHVIGTVEIVGCDWSDELGCYRWHLARPKRIAPRRPRNRPQPVWFYPFTE